MECVTAPPAWRRTPRRKAPVVTPVAANSTSPRASSWVANFLSGSVMPISAARWRWASSSYSSRPWSWPPMQRSAAAASTPSGAPPEPRYMSMPESGCEHATTAATSPSGSSTMRAPAARQALMISWWRSRSSMHTTRSFTEHFLARASSRRFSAGDASRSTTPAGMPGPTAILSM
mgnify:CR=1 FL=1